MPIGHKHHCRISSVFVAEKRGQEGQSRTEQPYPESPPVVRCRHVRFYHLLRPSLHAIFSAEKVTIARIIDGPAKPIDQKVTKN
jgi:hypothetical protein